MSGQRDGVSVGRPEADAGGLSARGSLAATAGAEGSAALWSRHHAGVETGGQRDFGPLQRLSNDDARSRMPPVEPGRSRRRVFRRGASGKQSRAAVAPRGALGEGHAPQSEIAFQASTAADLVVGQENATNEAAKKAGFETELRFLVKLPFVLESGACISFMDVCVGCDLRAMAKRCNLSPHAPKWSRVFSAIDYVDKWRGSFSEGQTLLAMHYNSA
jgi:hypothetical protein